MRSAWVVTVTHIVLADDEIDAASKAAQLFLGAPRMEDEPEPETVGYANVYANPAPAIDPY